MKKFLIGFLIVVGVTLVTFAIKIIFFPVNTINTSLDMTSDIVDDTLTAENAIYNYEYFKKQAESIQALRNKEVTADEAISSFKEIYGDDSKDWKKEDKVEYNRLNTNLTGIKNMLDDAIADYNAKSSMTNRAIFKDGLPSNLTRAVIDGMQLITN